MNTKDIIKIGVRFILGIIIFICIVTSITNWLSEGIPVEYCGEYSIYYVSKGDRLWNIAEQFAKGKDIRDVVYIIRKDNNLDNANIYIGQELKIRKEY